MATIVTKSIGSGGGRDYATIAAFLDAVPANLVSADQAWVGELYNDSEFSITSKYTLASKTTSATCYIKLKAAAGQSFRDHANKLTNALRYNQSNGVGVTCSVNFDFQMDLSAAADVIIEGLQFKVTATYGKCIKSSGTGSKFLANIVQALTGNTLIDVGGEVINNVIYMTSTSAENHAIYLGAGSAKAYFNTLHSVGGNGYGRPAAGFGSTQFKDSIHIGFPQDPNPPTCAYNATDDATTPGTNNVTSITASATWESVTSGSWDFRVKSGASVINAGTPISGITEDILGQTRSATTPTIGAFEVVSASSSATITSTADDAVFSGSASVSPLSAIAATTADAAFSGSASSSPASPTAALSATADDAVFAGSASAVAAGSFTTTAKARNNAGSLEASVAVTWSWNYGSVGAETGRVTGSGSTSNNGYFTANGLAAGAGYLLMKTAGGAVYYEEGTVS